MQKSTLPYEINLDLMSKLKKYNVQRPDSLSQSVIFFCSLVAYGWFALL